MTDETKFPRYLSTAEVAEAVSMSRGWVFKQIRIGNLKAYNFGTVRPRYRVATTDLERFLQTLSWEPRNG